MRRQQFKALQHQADVAHAAAGPALGLPAVDDAALHAAAQPGDRPVDDVVIDAAAAAQGNPQSGDLTQRMRQAAELGLDARAFGQDDADRLAGAELAARGQDQRVFPRRAPGFL
ncbi:MAG TPA: hypothetical protein VHT52_06130 [Stellaceae bacterium]|jgi:hypothetical protein|nr:hypothetical protein [Stellaceae bacterium]